MENITNATSISKQSNGIPQELARHGHGIHTSRRVQMDNSLALLSPVDLDACTEMCVCACTAKCACKSKCAYSLNASMMSNNLSDSESGFEDTAEGGRFRMMSDDMSEESSMGTSVASSDHFSEGSLTPQDDDDLRVLDEASDDETLSSDFDANITVKLSHLAAKLSRLESTTRLPVAHEILNSSPLPDSPESEVLVTSDVALLSDANSCFPSQASGTFTSKFEVKLLQQERSRPRSREHSPAVTASASDTFRHGKSLDDLTTKDKEFSTNDEFDYLTTARPKRSSSLKGSKTPPGQFERKKVVRFADALGLDLVDVRQITNQDIPPEIPLSATQYLDFNDDDSAMVVAVPAPSSKYFLACFSQPRSRIDYLSQVSCKKVMLENCMVDEKDMTVKGTVRVVNLAFDKNIVIRVTHNGWLMFSDVKSVYVPNSTHANTERFAFSLSIPSYFAPGSRMEFAIMYSSAAGEFWDNNDGANYSIMCYAHPTLNDAFGCEQGWSQYS